MLKALTATTSQIIRRVNWHRLYHILHCVALAVNSLLATYLPCGHGGGACVCVCVLQVPMGQRPSMLSHRIFWSFAPKTRNRSKMHGAMQAIEGNKFCTFWMHRSACAAIGHCTCSGCMQISWKCIWSWASALSNPACMPFTIKISIFILLPVFYLSISIRLMPSWLGHDCKCIAKK